MTPFSRTNEQTSTLGQEDLAEDCHELEPHSPVNTESSWSIENADSSAGIHKGHRRKGSQCRLRAWIAIDRNALESISEEQRCTCPMIGCEIYFPSPKSMHLHLKTCASISRGFYKCIETGESVRVGRCDSDGCQELKGRFASAVSSSFESVKRRFSGRRSKPIQASQSCIEKELVPEESYSMESRWEANMSHPELAASDHMYLAELGTCIDGISPMNHEMDAHAAPLELYSTSDSYHRSIDPSHEKSFAALDSFDNNRTTCFEQENVRRYAVPQVTRSANYMYPVLQSYSNPPLHLAVQFDHRDALEQSLPGPKLGQAGPAELCARETSWRRHQLYSNNSTWSMSSPVRSGDSERFHNNNGAASRAKLATPQLQGQDDHCPHQSAVSIPSAYYYSEQMVIDDIGTENADDLPQLAGSPLPCAPRTDSASSSDPSVAPSMFSSFSSVSTGQSSLMSYKSTPASFDRTSFLGEDSIMFDEPESVESLPISKSQEQTYRSQISSSTRRRCDTAGVSFDNYVEPSPYISNRAMNSSQVPKRLHITKKKARSSPSFAPRLSESLPKEGNIKVSSPALASTSTANSLPSLMSTPSSSQPISPRKAHCRHCGLTCDMSNRSRHEKTCKRNPDVANVPRISCHHPGCTSTFNRRDNLIQHQRLQNHFEIGSVELKISLTPTRGSPAWDWAMQALGQQQQQQESGGAHVRGDDLCMGVDDWM